MQLSLTICLSSFSDRTLAGYLWIDVLQEFALLGNLFRVSLGVIIRFLIIRRAVTIMTFCCRCFMRCTDITLMC